MLRSLYFKAIFVTFCTFSLRGSGENSASGLQQAMNGVVEDASGAVVPDAIIRLKGPTDREVRSDQQGRFAFPGLRPGRYQIVVEKTGFEPCVQQLNWQGGAPELRLRIQPASARQAIHVVAAADQAAEAIDRLPGTLLENARAITVVREQEMRERDARSINDLLAFVPGMALNSLRTGGYHFYARGYRMGPEDTRVDGFTGLNLSGGYGASTFGIDQVVFLRGPAGILFGPAGSPGGMIQMITKKPQPIRSTQLDLRSSTFHGQGIGLWERPSISFDLDSTGAIIRSDRLLYRALATVENSRYFTANVLDRDRLARFSLLAKLDQVGRYTLLPVFQYGSMTRPAGGGIVVSPSTSLSTSDGRMGPIFTSDLSPHNVNLSAGGHRYFTSQSGFDFRAIPATDWTINLNYRWLRNDRHINQWTPEVNSPAQIRLLEERFEVLRLQSKSDSLNRHHNVDFNTSYEYRGSGWRNLAQVGTFSRVVGVRNTSPLGPVPPARAPIHIYTGQQPMPLQDLYPALAFGPWTMTTLWNGYWQTRSWLWSERLVLTFGLGYGQSHPGGQPVRKGNVIPNGSALFRLKRDMAVYYSYSESFNPVDPTLENFAGQRNVFEPITGFNHEAGLKLDLPFRRTTATLSFFRNGISNALVQSGINDVNVNGVRYYMAAGSRRARGAELSAESFFARDWFVSAAVAYTDGLYTGVGPASAAATLAIPGSRAEKTPRWSWNSRLRYERSEGRLGGWRAAIILLHQGERLGSNGARTVSAPDPLLLPAFTRLDASLAYRINRHWEWALYAENLTDRRIFINAATGASMEMMPPRSFTTRLSYRF